MYNIRLYKNTGFDAVNVPDSIGLLDTGGFEVLEFDDVNLVQGRYLTEVTLTVEPSDANQVDFAVVESGDDATAYTVNSYTMQTENTATFQLLLEPYTTLGGFKADSGNTIIGSAKRSHVSVADDDSKFYPNSEPFETKNDSEWTIYKLLEVGGDVLTIVECTANPAVNLDKTVVYKLGKINDVFITAIKENTYWFESTRATKGVQTGGAGNGVIVTDADNKQTGSIGYQESTSPQSRPMVGTKLITPTGTTVDTGTRWWQDEDRVSEELDFYVTYSSDTTKYPESIKTTYEVVADLISDGNGSSVKGYWEVPKVFLDMTKFQSTRYTPYEEDPTKFGGISQIAAKTASVTIPNTAAYAPFNKKLNYGQNKTIAVYNPASGAMINKPVYEVLTPGQTPTTMTGITGKIIPDIRITGMPVFFFDWIHGSDNDGNLMESVKGGNWRQLNLNVNGVASGQHIERLQQSLTLENIQKERSWKKEDYIWGQVGTLYQNGMQIVGGIKSASVGDIYQGLEDIVTGLVTNKINYDRDVWREQKAIKDQNTILNARAAYSTFNISPSNINLANDLDKNTFFAVVCNYSPDDLTMFDRFLTLYGYNVGSMMFTNETLNTRPAYNFIQINDANILSKKGNLALVNDVLDRLKSGLRIWHKKPEVTDFGSNSNR